MSFVTSSVFFSRFSSNLSSSYFFQLSSSSYWALASISRWSFFFSSWVVTLLPFSRVKPSKSPSVSLFKSSFSSPLRMFSLAPRIRLSSAICVLSASYSSASSDDTSSSSSERIASMSLVYFLPTSFWISMRCFWRRSLRSSTSGSCKSLVAFLFFLLFLLSFWASSFN